MNTTAEQLFHLIEKGGSPYQVVEEAEKRLKEAGFEKLEFHTAWGLTGGKSYYMIHHGTTLIAFTIPKNAVLEKVFVWRHIRIFRVCESSQIRKWRCPAISS